MSLLFSLLGPLLLEGERGGEYSETRLATFRAVVEKLVTETIATLAAGHFQGRWRLLMLGYAVWFYRLRESGPRRGVLELFGAVKEVIATLGAYIDT